MRRGKVRGRENNFLTRKYPDGRIRSITRRAPQRECAFLGPASAVIIASARARDALSSPMSQHATTALRRDVIVLNMRIIVGRASLAGRSRRSCRRQRLQSPTLSPIRRGTRIIARTACATPRSARSRRLPDSLYRRREKF